MKRWIICSTCEGEGKHSRHLGAFTGSEWAELDEETQDRYMHGAYDRACERCDGSGKILADQRSSEPEVCQCCGEDMAPGQTFCCTDEFPEPGQVRETGK
jgi:hypothetical protein